MNKIFKTAILLLSLVINFGFSSNDFNNTLFNPFSDYEDYRTYVIPALNDFMGIDEKYIILSKNTAYDTNIKENMMSFINNLNNILLDDHSLWNVILYKLRHDVNEIVQMELKDMLSEELKAQIGDNI